MTEEELVKAQSELIAAQQKLIDALSGDGNVTLYSPASEEEDAPPEARGITLSEYVPSFLKSRKNSVKKSTYSNYVYMLELSILPMLGNTELGKIDNKRMQNFADELLKTYKNHTVRDNVGLVKNILNDAYMNDVIEAKKFTIRYPKDGKKNYEVMADEDFCRLEEYLFRHSKPHDIGQLLLMETGMRVGEMCGLVWEDVNFGNGSIRISRTVQRIYDREKHTTALHIGSTKTSSSERIIPISVRFCGYLERNRKEDGIYVASGKNTPTEPRTHRAYHSRLLKRLGIDYITQHGLRHTFATRAIRCGVDPKTVSAILGHSDSSITLNIYTSVTEEMLRQGIEKMEQKKDGGE